MCMVVYLASERPLPVIPWNPSRPAFHVEGLTADLQAVRGRFSKPFVYYAGSHERCGCGFDYEAASRDNLIAEDLAASSRNRESRALLARYLDEALAKVPEVELYACWSGEEEQPEESHAQIRPEALTRDRTYFQERQRLVIRREETPAAV